MKLTDTQYVFRTADMSGNEGTTRIDCPNCNRHTLSVSWFPDGTVLWNCYRASCPTRGASEQNLSARQIARIRNRAEATTKTETTFVWKDYPFTHNFSDSAKGFMHMWRFPYAHPRIYEDVKRNRMVFPIYNASAKIVDAAGRALDSGQNPKWYRYSDSGLPYIAAELGRVPTSDQIMILVEDCVSAEIVNEIAYDAVGVALLGTNLSQTIRDHLALRHILRREDAKNVIVCLDRDAAKKSIEMFRTLSNMGHNVMWFVPQQDPKMRHHLDVEQLKAMAHTLRKRMI